MILIRQALFSYTIYLSLFKDLQAEIEKLRDELHDKKKEDEGFKADYDKFLVRKRIIYVKIIQ